MSWRSLPFIILIVLITIFIGLNLKNACDVSFGFYTFHAVPVFLTVLASFCAGMIIALPAAFFRRHKSPPRTESMENAVYDKVPAKKRRSGRSKKDPNTDQKAEVDEPEFGID